MTFFTFETRTQNKETGKIWLWVVGCLVVGIVFILWPANPFELSAKEVEIPKGASARIVQDLLIERGILPRYTLFRQIVRLLNLQDKIKSGRYSFSPSDSLPKVVTKLVLGETLPPLQIRVTFPEGSSIYKMGIILKKHGFERWQEFQDLVHEGITASLRERHWNIFKFVPSESLEGYLFPDTYYFLKDSSVEVLAEIMVRRFEEVVLPFWEKAKSNTKLNLHEILTLASIIEKEAKIPSERPVISSVFYNRLRADMPLAADPTIKYALERPTKIVYLDQLSVKSPYNTYKRRGLPPGPICNPGLESIKAAVYPAKTDFFFFVARPDGSHIFSKTWSEHQRAREKKTK